MARKNCIFEAGRKGTLCARKKTSTARKNSTNRRVLET
jgi:hypothetical protein